MQSYVNIKMVTSNNLCSYLNKSGQSNNNQSHCKYERLKIIIKPNINALIIWWILLDLLQLRCRWIEKFVTYSYGNESYCSKE
jgi:hypothetical protein